MIAPIQPINLSHCILSPILPNAFSPTRSFAHPVRAYTVKAKQTGTEWQVKKVIGGDFAKWAINGQGETYSSPEEAAKAINRMLQG